MNLPLPSLVVETGRSRCETTFILYFRQNDGAHNDTRATCCDIVTFTTFRRQLYRIIFILDFTRELILSFYNFLSFVITVFVGTAVVRDVRQPPREAVNREYNLRNRARYPRRRRQPVDRFHF